MHENLEMGSGRYNIAKKNLTKWDNEVLEAEKKVKEVGLTKFSKVEYWTPNVGNKKFWKLDRNVLKVYLRSLRRRIHENRDVGSRRSNIA